MHHNRKASVTDVSHDMARFWYFSKHFGNAIPEDNTGYGCYIGNDRSIGKATAPYSAERQTIAGSYHNKLYDKDCKEHYPVRNLVGIFFQYLFIKNTHFIDRQHKKDSSRQFPIPPYVSFYRQVNCCDTQQQGY